MTTPPAQNLPHCYSLVPVSELFCVCVRVRTQSCPTLCDPHQASLSLGFSRQESWRGLLFPIPGDLPDPRMKPKDETQGLLRWQADSLPLSHLGAVP